MTMMERMGMVSLLLATVFLSMLVAEASVDKMNGIRNLRNNPTTNKAKLESLVRQQNLLPPLMHDEDLPVDNANEKWQSLNQDVEFIPADGLDRRVVHRFLEQGYYSAATDEEEEYGGMSGMEDIYDVQPFAYGDNEYDEYQQAWRLMGFIIDCNPMVDDDYYQQENSGSGDQGTEDGCARYVLWAAVSANAFHLHCF